MKIVLNLPGNTFHSNVLKNRWKEMYDAKVGLDAIGASGVPVAISYQGIDYKIMPWLATTLAKYPSIDVINAPHSHALIPLQPEEMQQWETKVLVPNSIDASFFAEFYAPQEKFIPTKFYFALEGMSFLYSACGLDSHDVLAETLPNAPAIKHGGKIGIIMRDSAFGPILKAFFRFQRDPLSITEDTNNKAPLEHLLDEIEKVGNMPEGVIVVPIDIEAPWVGSAWGVKIWEMFFQGIVRRGLKDVFTPLSSAFDYFEANAVNSIRPHRILTKWTSFEVQVKHLMKVNALYAETKNARVLSSIAGCSDILSALDSKIKEGKKAIVHTGKDPEGAEVKLPVSYNQDIINVQRAALRAMTNGTTFETALDDLVGDEGSNSLFVQRMLNVAEGYEI